MPPKCKSSSGPTAITPYEDDLLHVAVHLDSAIRHWEKQLAKRKVVDARWMTDGMGEELDSVGAVFAKQKAEHPQWAPPYVHPIVTLVGEEYKRSLEEDCPMNPANISIARSTELCWKRRNANPDLSHHLSHMSLHMHLKHQEGDFWWLPGIPDPDDADEDEDEEVHTPLDNTPERSGEQPAAAEHIGVQPAMAEHSEEDAGVVPMDEDEGNSQTPCISRTQKRTIVISPSEKDKHPAKHAKFTDLSDFCGPCQLSKADECVPQAVEKRNAYACQACAGKKRSCVPPPKWAEKPRTLDNEPSASNSKPGRQRSTTVKQDDVMPLLHKILSTIQSDGQEIKDRLYNLEAMVRAQCVQAQIQPSSLTLRILAVPAFSAPSPSTSTLSTSTASTISSASSSSAVHVPRMTFTGPPSAGPSASGFTPFQPLPSRTGGGARPSRSREPSASGSRAPSLTRTS